MNQDVSYDVSTIRKDFPILNQYVHNKPLIYLDNAATTQKPQVVIDRVNRIYTQQNSNIHRGVHYLSNKLTEEYEQARERVRQFIHAQHAREVIFTNGTTQSI